MKSHARRIFYRCLATTGLAFGFGSMTWSQTLTWDQSITLGDVVKAGMGRLDSTEYQYDIIGLGGTTLRVGPYGFTSEAAPKVFSPAGCLYYPYLGYEYWWNEKSHRQAPFSVFGGYVTTSHGIDVRTNGQITAFNHRLAIRTGVLSIDLGLNVGGTAFASRREEFVTPAGVWTIRVSDSGATKPFVLRVGSTVDAVDGNIYTFSSETKPSGIVITAATPGASTAVLALGWTGDVIVDTVGGFSLTGRTANETLTFFLAPASSYALNGEDPVQAAWGHVEAALTAGYENELQATASWWNEYWGRHQIDLPVSEGILAQWYTRSLYYHGVFFGNTDVPPGLWGTSVAPGGGAVCPEFDLVFSQLALLYSNHITESANIIGWLKATQPQAEKNALNTTLYSASVSHDWGALYGCWVGYDGKYILPGTAAEGNLLYEDFPSANCALMAVKHGDFTLDPGYAAFADTIVRKTTKVQADDQWWNGRNYVNVHSPSSMNQAGCIFGLSQSVARGQADSAWSAMLPKVLLPTGIWTNPAGRRYQVLVGGAGATASPAAGDAPQLAPLWWYGTMQKDNLLVPPTYQLVNLSNTASYVFNRGTMSVIASKLHDASEAYRWAMSLTGADVTYDDATISEMVHDAYDFQRTPEIAAHGALICAVTQMLVDPDNNNPIEIFPAIPKSWWSSGVSFSNILVKGGIAVSGKIDASAITAQLANSTAQPAAVTLRVWLPPGTTALAQAPAGTVVANGYATLNDTLGGKSSREYSFVLPATSVRIKDTPFEFSLSQNYPNPFNPSTEFFYSLPSSVPVTVSVYNVLGQEIATLVDEQQGAGKYHVTFDGSTLPSGIYIYRIQAGSNMAVRKMVLIK